VPSALSRPRRSQSARLQAVPSPRRDQGRLISTRRGPEELVNVGRLWRLERPKTPSASRQTGSELQMNPRLDFGPASRLRGAVRRDVDPVESSCGGHGGDLMPPGAPRNPGWVQVPLRPPGGHLP